jgi:methylated-DNA-[protein]-cysteine S-methyltransferase
MTSSSTMTAETTRAATYPSSVGSLTLIAGGAGLRAILWEGDDPARSGLAAVPPRGATDDSPVLAETRRQLDAYFAGTRTTFDLPLDLRGTPFQQAAWLALAEIPFAETRTYAEQAARLGRPRAFRAVGAANGRNPLSIVLPCHRVVGSDGSLTGFAGGLRAKRWLLAHELSVAQGIAAPPG